MSYCYVDPDPRFEPATRLISSITRANPAVITTSCDHGYLTGCVIRFHIPLSVGMSQLNYEKANITVTGTDTFTVDIDTTKFDSFSIPASPSWYDNTCALVVPIGEISSTFTSSVKDVT